MAVLVGLTGGIGCGKSTVTELLKAKPEVALIFGDQLGHEAYKTGTKCYTQLVETFGEQVVDPETKAINRRALGSIVFGDPAKLQQLNQIVWPFIREAALARVEQLRNSDPSIRVVVFEAAVLLEAGWSDMCDECWTVVAPESSVVSRLKERNGLSEEESLKRIRSQMSSSEREQRCHRIIRNEGSLEDLRQSFNSVWADFAQKYNL